MSIHPDFIACTAISLVWPAMCHCFTGSVEEEV